MALYNIREIRQWRHLNTVSPAITLSYILCFFKAQLHRHNNKLNLKNKFWSLPGLWHQVSYLTSIQRCLREISKLILPSSNHKNKYEVWLDPAHLLFAECLVQLSAAQWSLHLWCTPLQRIKWMPVGTFGIDQSKNLKTWSNQIHASHTMTNILIC